MSKQVKERANALIDYLEAGEWRMTRREIDDLLSRGGQAPTEAETDEMLARLCRTGRLVRTGTIKQVPDREDGVYCVPSKREASTIGSAPARKPGARRYSVARGAPADDLMRRNAPDMIEGDSGGGWSPPRKSND